MFCAIGERRVKQRELREMRLTVETRRRKREATAFITRWKVEKREREAERKLVDAADAHFFRSRREHVLASLQKYALYCRAFREYSREKLGILRF